MRNAGLPVFLAVDTFPFYISNLAIEILKQFFKISLKNRNPQEHQYRGRHYDTSVVRTRVSTNVVGDKKKLSKNTAKVFI